jgi:hypothetical protein
MPPTDPLSKFSHELKGCGPVALTADEDRDQWDSVVLDRVGPAAGPAARPRKLRRPSGTVRRHLDGGHTVWRGPRGLGVSDAVGRPLAGPCPKKRARTFGPGPRVPPGSYPSTPRNRTSSRRRLGPDCPWARGTERTDYLSKPSGHFTCQQQEPSAPYGAGLAGLACCYAAAYCEGAGTRCFAGDSRSWAFGHPRIPVPHGNLPAQKGGAMATSNRMICPFCSRPIVLGAYTIMGHGEMAHAECRKSANTWPEGTRHLVCLNCGRAFPSDSKAQRLCKACRRGPEGTVRPVTLANEPTPPS